MILNPSLVPWLILFRLYKTSIIWQLITLAAIKVCSKTPFSKRSYHIEIGQLICKSTNLLISIWYEFSVKYFLTEYNAGFLQIYTYF